MPIMIYDFGSIKNKGKETEEWLRKEISSLRTGRASPVLVENIMIDSYGAKTPLKHIASITAEDARTLRITPWDKGAIRNIEQGIVASNLGVQPIVDQQTVRITMPELTEERRKSLIKILNEKLEQVKVSLRVERDEVWKDIQEKERGGEISEDDKFKFKEDLQKIMDGILEGMETIAKKKEEEIKS